MPRQWNEPKIRAWVPHVTPLQYGGYSIALAGVVAYTRYKTAKSAAVPTAAARKVAGDVVPKDVSAASEEEAAPLAYEDGRERTPNDEDGEQALQAAG